MSHTDPYRPLLDKERYDHFNYQSEETHPLATLLETLLLITLESFLVDGKIGFPYMVKKTEEMTTVAESAGLGSAWSEPGRAVLRSGNQLEA